MLIHQGFKNGGEFSIRWGLWLGWGNSLIMQGKNEGKKSSIWNHAQEIFFLFSYFLILILQTQHYIFTFKRYCNNSNNSCTIQENKYTYSEFFSEIVL